MPIPPNTTALTATPLGSLPASLTQDASDGAGTTYDLWYSFVAPAGATVVGAWGFDSGLAYEPSGTIYRGPASAPTVVLGIDGVPNTPFQFPVTPGQLYLLKFSPSTNAQPSILALSVLVAPEGTPAAGNILIMDDTAGFPLTILSDTTDYTVVAYVDSFASGEQADSLQAAGVILAYDGGIPSGVVVVNPTNTFILYNASFTPIATIPRLNASPGMVRSNPVLGKFYIASAGLPSGPPTQIRSVDPVGTLGAVQTIGGSTLNAIAPNNNETILYYTREDLTGSHPPIPIKRWDLVNQVGLSDFIVGVDQYTTGDLLVLADGSILVSYFRVSTSDFYVKRYDAAANLLTTYAFGTTGINETIPRLGYGPDATSFWVWLHFPDGISHQLLVDVPTGATRKTRLQMEYEDGFYAGNETATPHARFGMSFSCPIFVYPQVTTPIPPPAEGPPACPLGFSVGDSGGPVARIPWTSEDA